jgi:radical SAM superfamily enzyme YgiQ (UPF0313 family)
MPAEIVLCTLNARWSHTSLALRCLQANLGEFQARSILLEFVIGVRAEKVAQRLLDHSPRIVGFSVYIWNVSEITRIVRLLKLLAPQIIVVLGGPEVSHDQEGLEIARLADHVIQGPGEKSFANLCRGILMGPRPLMKLIPGDAASADQLATLKAPYRLYSDGDLRQRLTYVEASRGCPFKCEFCLSALDKTAWAFPLNDMLAHLDELYRRGARTFKFIDRTFNLKIENSRAILRFFLERYQADDPVFAHFEVIPDHLPQGLRELVREFRPGALQFEIGIQSLDPQVQARISRRQDNAKAEANIRWLVEHTQVHLHLDLIAGLPGETLDGFGNGFDRLVDWLDLASGRKHDIQLGLLKRLRGAPIARHIGPHAMVFDPDPPYALLKSDVLSFEQVRRFQRAASHWEQLQSLDHAPWRDRLFRGSSFQNLIQLSQWLDTVSDAPERFAPARFGALVEQYGLPA